MANAFGNPIVLDSTMAATWRNTASNNAPQNESINIKKVMWDGPAAGGTFVMQYGDGTTFLAGTAQATTAPSSVNYDFFGGMTIFDFKLTTLSSGKIYIYYSL